MRQLGLNWTPTPLHAPGEQLYRDLVQAGYDGVPLTSDEMRQYVEHIAHATSLLGRGGLGHWRGNHKVRGALGRVMGSRLAQELLSDDSLDR